MNKFTKVLLFIIVALCVTGFFLFRQMSQKKGDHGDAPEAYGDAFHRHPEKGPCLGIKRGDVESFEDLHIDYFALAANGQLDMVNKEVFNIGEGDDYLGEDDEDAFKNNFTDFNEEADKIAVFLPDISADESVYRLEVPVSFAAVGDPVVAWIDFDGNQFFDETEKSIATYQSGNKVDLNWMIPNNLTPKLTQARIRICSKAYAGKLEVPIGGVEDGEVEDYAVRIYKRVSSFVGNRETLNLSQFNGLYGEKALKAIDGLAFCNTKVYFRPEPIEDSLNFAINNLHDEEYTGLRIVRDSGNYTKQKNANKFTIRFEQPVQNLSFKILDIDAGDHIKINGSYQQNAVQYVYSNLTNNFYFFQNSIDKYFYVNQNLDAGNSLLATESRNNGVQIDFAGLVDSVTIEYWDFIQNGSYTFTDMSARKMPLPAIFFKETNANENLSNVDVSFGFNNSQFISKFFVERSYKNESNDFSLIDSVDAIRIDTPVTYCFKDSLFNRGSSNVYYRIMAMEMDGAVTSSRPFQAKRNFLQVNPDGFKDIAYDPKAQVISFTVIDSLAGKSQLRLYDYSGETLIEKTFSDIKKGQRMINVFPNNIRMDPVSVVFIELSNGNKRILKYIQLGLLNKPRIKQAFNKNGS
jgi:hypothetical protein